MTRLRAMDARTSPAEAQRALDDAGPENVEDMIKRVRAWWEEDTSRNALRHFRGLVKLARESPDGYRRADAPFDADGDADFPGYSPALRRAAREMAARGLKASDPEGARILRDAAR